MPKVEAHTVPDAVDPTGAGCADGGRGRTVCFTRSMDDDTNDLTPVPPPDAVAPDARSGAARSQHVRDTATGAVTPWAVRDRAALSAGAAVTGPAIIAEDETSTLVGPGWTATLDPRGYLDLRRDA